MQGLCNFPIRETFLLINYPCNSRPNPKNFYSEQTTALELQSTLVKGGTFTFISKEFKSEVNIKIFNVKSNTFGNPNFQKDLQN